MRVRRWLEGFSGNFGFGTMLDGPDQGKEVHIPKARGRRLFVDLAGGTNRYRFAQESRPPRRLHEGDVLIALVRPPANPERGHRPWLSLWGIESEAMEGFPAVPVQLGAGRSSPPARSAGTDTELVVVAVTKVVAVKYFGFGRILTGGHVGEDAFLHPNDAMEGGQRLFEEGEFLEGQLEEQPKGLRLRSWRFTGRCVTSSSMDCRAGHARAVRKRDRILGHDKRAPVQSSGWEIGSL